MIETLLPKGFVGAETWCDLGEALIYTEELAQVSGSGEGRVLEFISARACARDALRKLGFPPRPILIGRSREPLWPADVIGSITHCSGYRAAAVGRRTTGLLIGIDAELHEPLPKEIRNEVCLPSEHQLSIGSASEFHVDRLTFSAKESVYKALFPALRTWIGFHDAETSFNTDKHTFDVRVTIANASRDDRKQVHLCGRFLVERGIILTVAVVDLRAVIAL
jgi:4'-phosphopantetheinyl transferase EntD